MNEIQKKDMLARKASILAKLEKKGLERNLSPNRLVNSSVGVACLLIDCSTSMEGEGLRQAKRGAANFAKDALGKRYKAGIVSFSCYAKVITEPSNDSEQIRRAIEQMSVEGSTDMAEGLRQAGAMVRACPKQKTVVLVTDGYPNDEDEALSEAMRLRKSGIEIITIGTEDANHAFLRKIASRSDLVIPVERKNLAIAMQSAARALPAPKD
ncbi:vWA domain-containing protein [Coraliomargarita parva]|uniref:vWA domain-containing protein n=1 Tax=Coraliomargarita parva TaxID=3014050 RepID=UPI0022B5923A|nr:vWA domain-containing protein [Coraliomargarita parva]